MLKDVRTAIMDALKEHYGDAFKSYITGTPWWVGLKQTPYLAVYSDTEHAEWKGQRAYELIGAVVIEIGVDASGEDRTQNRGIYNENLLNDTAEEIIGLIYSKLHHIGPATLIAVDGINYGQREGLIRVAQLTVRYRATVIFTPQ